MALLEPRAVEALFACMIVAMRNTFPARLAVGTIVILLGSVHLGWHYAIDGYFSIAAVLVIRWLSGRFSRRWHVSLQSVPPSRN